MGSTCIICPCCGFRECGTSRCPNCGIVVDGNGGLRREVEGFLLCPSCGHSEKGSHVFCPACGSGIMVPVSGASAAVHSHAWNGTTLTCRNGCVRSTIMSRDTAREIPYCPFCMEELSARPTELVHRPKDISSLRLPELADEKL